MGLEQPQHPEQEPSLAAACKGGVTRTRSPSVPVPEAWAGTMGTPGRGAGCAAGCEGIAAAEGMEVAAGFDAFQELCGKSSFCF